MRRVIVAIAAGILVLAGMPAHGEEDPAFKFSEKFADFDLAGQAQLATGCAFIAAVECDRLIGAQVQVTKPSTVFALASVFQRGLATSYAWGSSIGGGAGSGSGGKGIIPTFPGEAVGLYPSEPREGTFAGPVTTAANGAVVDGRAHAKATEAPSGSAIFELQHVDVPEQLTVEDGVVFSRGGPVEQGVDVESMSVLENLVIAKVLKIRSLTSRAYGLIPGEPGEAQGVGYTSIEGASVNDTPVEITEKGITLGEQTQGEAEKDEAQAQLRQALAAASIEDIRLTQATAVPGEDGQSIEVKSGLLQVVYNNKEFGAANPQGFSGGSFEVGGANVEIAARRADDSSEPAAEPGPSSGPEPISDPFNPSSAAMPAPDAPGSVDPAASEPFGTGSAMGSLDSAEPGGASYPSIGSSSQGSYYSELASLSSGRGLSAAAGDSGSTLATTGPASAPAPRAVLRAVRAGAVGDSGPGTDQWMETIYLGLIAVPLLLVVAFRLSVAR